jgi:hypothetical protein
VGPLRQWRDLWLQTCSSETVMQKGVIAVPFGGAWKSMGQIFNHDVAGSTQPGWQAVIVLITTDYFPLHGILSSH